MKRVRWWLLIGCPLLLSACGTPGGAGHKAVDPAASKWTAAVDVSPAKPGVAYQRFMIIGDFGTTVPNPQTSDEMEYAADQKKVADAMAIRAKSDGLDFMITVGDNFYEDGVKNVDDPMFKSAFADIYAGPLGVTTYASLETMITGSVQAQINYSKKNEKWYMPAPYYTFTRTLGDGTKLQFFAVDTTPIKEKKPSTSAQEDWLDQELGKSDARWKFVFGHHPLYCHTVVKREPERVTLRAAFKELFEKHKVDAYFAGHDHLLEMLKPVGGVEYLVSGAAAGPKKAYEVEFNENEAFYAATLGGFVLARVSKDEAVFEFVRLDGKTEYARIVEKK